MRRKMEKKAKTELEAKKTKEKLETQIQRTRKTFLRRLQVMKESCDINCDSNDSDRVLLQRRSTSRKSSKRNPTFFHTNVRNEDAIRDDYMCYRCQHFLEIPRNLSRPFVSNRMSTGFVERCKEELSFVQAIICLKSVSASVSQISVEQLQQIFDRQWDTRGERHCEDNDIEQSPVNKGLISERTPMRDTFTTSTPLSISDTPYITPQRTVSYTTRFEDTRGKLLSSTSTNNPNQSAVESLLILESSNSCRIAAREKKKEVESCIIPETDVESILNESLDMFDSMPEHQCFEFEKDTERSVRSASKSGIEQINKKIIESKQKSYADIPNEGKTILPPRNQFIDSMIDSENNFIDFISMKSQNLTDRVLDRQQSADCSPKSLIITQKDISQMSNVNNDEYFEFLFDDNNPWQMSNTTTGNPHEDSAYSTSRNDIFNNDTAVEAGLIAGNKRLSDTEHYCKLQPCKKKAIVDETGKVSSSINGMSTSAGNSKSLITGKDISQISDVNDENVEFQIVNSYDGWMSDIISEDSEDDVAVAAESFGDKCTPNIEHCYDLHNSPCNEKTITREKMMTSASIIQGTVISDNIEHHYNLRVNNRRISREKEVSSTIIGSKERKSRRTWRLLEKENENENKMISADWLNFTLDSLHIEHVIIKSLKVILSTFCDKKMVEEYMIREQLRNTRNYWKGSLEEEAVNAILNISDIFTTEKKPNICIKVIMIAITTALNEMMRAQLNKMYYTETSVWIYRVQIILEFCNSLPICVKITDYLITRLKSLQSVLTNVKKIQRNTCIIINQLDLVFYALNITLRKYRIIIPIDRRSRSVEKIILHVADLWKIHYIDKELEYTSLNLDAAEKRWLNVLENSAVVFTKHFAVSQFAEESFSLVHVLIS